MGSTWSKLCGSQVKAEESRNGNITVTVKKKSFQGFRKISTSFFPSKQTLNSSSTEVKSKLETPIASKTSHPKSEPAPGSGVKSDVDVKSGSTADDKTAKHAEDTDITKTLYTVEKVLGHGGYGTVYAAHRNEDNLPVAIKYVLKKRITEWEMLHGKTVPMEVYALSLLNHVVGVITMVDYYPRAQDFIIVTERPDGAIDLHEYVTHAGLPSEDMAKEYYFQIVMAVSEIHRAGIFHRDLKLENMLLDNKGNIHIIDFGSAMILRDSAYKEPLGSRIFSPPEYIEHNKYYAEEATVWSLGIVLFCLVIGNIPFIDEDDILNAEDFVHAQLSFRGGLSRELHHLIRQCLQFKGSRRPKIQAILHHDWLLEQTIMVKKKTKQLRNRFMAQKKN